MLRPHDFRGGYYDWPPPTLREVRARWLRWLGLAAVSVAVLALVAFVIDHDDPQPGLSDRAWLTLAAAAVLLVALGIHYRRGSLALLRAVAEYATVALLAVLLTITAQPAPAAPPGQAAKQQAAKPPAAEQPAGRVGAAGTATGDGCPPVRQMFAWVGCLWRQANPPASTTPKQGRAMPLSPAPPARRTP